MNLDNGLSALVARHVADYPAQALPETTLHAAKRVLLDGLGVMLAASGASPEVTPFIEYAAASGHGPATILGCGLRTSPEMAALANGAMAHALDFEDALDAAPGHPNAALLPAVLAIAQAHPPVGGRELLSAIAIGCDLSCRMALSLRRPMEEGGWYPPPILGAFGAVAAAARLLRLDAAGIRDALSLMLCQATMPGEIKYSAETVIRAIREALPAQAAVRSAFLAAAGVRGFEQPLEGKGGFFRLFADGQFDPRVIRDGLGERFVIEELTFKRWPACRGTHAYIEAVQALRHELGISASEVDEIVAVGGELQEMLTLPLERKRAPASAIDAKFSIPFAIAAALIDEEVTLDSFGADRLRDPRRLDLAARVSWERRPDWGRERAASAVLRLRLKDGRAFERTIDVAAGHPSRPLGDDLLNRKFADCAARARNPLSPESSDRLIQAIWSLEGSRDVAEALSLQ